ncbi:hypothetical protein ABEV34_11805 [Methylorubrum rhodesianum]|uniref:hypothetical protein n=1 Tax=Methylorubrum TaxID=2282523 RepID=UPI0016170FE0|nr:MULTISPECIES: hypothetical protein [Methylorubrum]MBB5765725.1 hypothetical protein [Methylorubrum rhodesianum]MBI1691507.1 hypothetical protein [Methylorubrum sp. DB1722]
MLGLILAAVPGLLGKLLDFAQKRADSDRAKHEADVGADVATNAQMFQAWIVAQQQVAAARNADRASLLTAWMMPLAFGLAISHFGAVTFDCYPWPDIPLGRWTIPAHAVGSWRVAAMPGEYLEIQKTIIWAGVGLIGLLGVKKTFAR